MSVVQEMFKTSNLYLAAFIYSCGIEPVFESVSPGKIIFCFPSSPEIDRLILNFNNNISIRVLDFSGALKTLRGRMNDLKYAARQGV
jgi:hypothetical protein